MKISSELKRLLGGYIIGFNIASDHLANGAKWFLEKVHVVVPTIALISLAHKGVVQLEKTRDMLSMVIHKYAHCTRCRGRGYLMVMSVSGEYVGKEPCPQCHGTGQDYKAILEKADEKAHLPILSKRETAIAVFDKILDKSREERLIKNIYCKKCKGQRLVHVRDEEGKYLGQKPCPFCNGTGKDYKAMYTELAITCIKDYLTKGHSKDDAWNYCNEFFKDIEQSSEKLDNIKNNILILPSESTEPALQAESEIARTY